MQLNVNPVNLVRWTRYLNHDWAWQQQDNSLPNSSHAPYIPIYLVVTATEQAFLEMARLQAYQPLIAVGVLQQLGGPGHIPHFNHFSREVPLGKSRCLLINGSSSLRAYRRVMGKLSDGRQLPSPFGEPWLILYGTWDWGSQSLTFFQN